MNERPTLLLHANLFDGTGAPPAAGVDLLIADGRIAALGRNLRHDEAETIDLGGRTVVPGLIDCHVHLCVSGNPQDAARIAATPAPVVAWTAAESARLALEAGFTTVRDLAGPHDVAILLRDAVEERRLPGPRIRAAGAGVCMSGGHGWSMGARQADGPDEVRKAVREQLRAGADCIKLFATGGVMTPRVDPRSAQLTEEELRAGVEEAHKAFVKVASHAQGTAGIKNAVRAGVDSIEHGIFLDAEAIELMKERGTFFVPTLAAPENISRHGLDAGVPSYMVEKGERLKQAHRESFKQAMRAGVRIAMGTDAGTPFNRHGANAEEIALMVAGGMPATQALLAATRDAAELLDLPDQIGTVEVTKSADLLIVDGDPLTEVSILCDRERTVGILKGGRWIRKPPLL